VYLQQALCFFKVANMTFNQNVVLYWKIRAHLNNIFIVTQEHCYSENRKQNTNISLQQKCISFCWDICQLFIFFNIYCALAQRFVLKKKIARRPEKRNFQTYVV
jgi:hypothetical protein